jgi:hypothetical protein
MSQIFWNLEGCQNFLIFMVYLCTEAKGWKGILAKTASISLNMPTVKQETSLSSIIR